MHGEHISATIMRKFCRRISCYAPNNAIWHGSTLARVAWFLAAPSHHLIRCWLLISEVPWQTPITQRVSKLLSCMIVWISYFNSLRPRQNGRHFADDIFECIFSNENVWISLEISLKFVPEVRIDNIPALVQIIALRRPGDKPLSESMMVSLLTHICVNRPQWVKNKCVISQGPMR